MKKKFLYESIITILIITMIVFIAVIFFVESNIYESKQSNTPTFYENNWIFEDGKGIEKEVDLPTKEATKSKIISIKKKIETKDVLEKVCLIKTHHQFVKIYIDDILKYEFDGASIEKGKYYKSAGNSWILFKIDKEYYGKIIKIEYESVYKKTMGEVDDILVGKESECIGYIISKNAIKIIISAITLGISGFMILLWFTLRKNNYSSKLLELALCTGFTSIWSLLETEIVQFYVPYTETLSIITFCMLIFSPMPAVLYEYGDNNKKKLLKIVLNFNLVMYVVVFFLQIFCILDFSESIIIIHINTLLSLITSILIEMKNVFSNKISNRMDKLLLKIGVVAVELSVVVDIARYYIENNLSMTLDSAFFSRIGLLLYITLVGVKTTDEIFEMMNLTNKEDVWHELAYKDILTSVGSRLGYLEKIESLENMKNNIVIFSIDLNNLKGINDSLGHSAGDKYISSCVKVIVNIFDKDGSCYRVGGDEFIVILEEYNTVNFEKYIKKLDYANENMWVEKQKISFAYGKAIYDSKTDKSLYDTVSRADKEMYANKERIKKLIKDKWARNDA